MDDATRATLDRIFGDRTNSTTPTLTVALGVIQALYPDELT